MPSSLLPSRSALSSDSISARSLAFVSIRCSRRSARNFFLFAAVDFFGIARHPFPLNNLPRYLATQVIAESPIYTGAHKLTGLGLTLEDHHPVDFGRLAGRSPAQPRGAPGQRTLNQDL